MGVDGEAEALGVGVGVGVDKGGSGDPITMVAVSPMRSTATVALSNVRQRTVPFTEKGPREAPYASSYAGWGTSKPSCTSYPSFERNYPVDGSGATSKNNAKPKAKLRSASAGSSRPCAKSCLPAGTAADADAATN